MSLRLFHSIWTAPQKSDRWGFDRKTRNYVDLLCAAISVACAKMNGCSIALHTDNAGKERYGWLPYDEVHTTLQSHQFDTAFWASGKIISQQYEPLCAVHIDTDVFLKSEKTVALFEDLKNYDLLVQHAEWNYQSSYNRWTWETFVNIMGGTQIPGLPEFTLNPCHGYCAGVVGFNNQALKDLYINGYKLLAALLTERPLWDQLKNDFCPDLIIEQGWLYSAAQATGARVKQVLQNNDKFDALDCDFCHIINTAKYEKETILECERYFKYINAPLFEDFKQKTNFNF